MRSFQLSTILLILASATPAVAVEQESIRVDGYTTPDGCPSQQSFREQVERRGHRPGSVRVTVDVRREDRDLRGTIHVTDARGETSSRNVQSARCDEVISALALVAALARDESPPAVESEATAPAAREPTPRTNIDAPAPQTKRHEPTRKLELGLGVQGGVQSGVSPDAIVSGGLFAEVASRALRPTGVTFEPTARIAWSFAGTDRVASGTAQASFQWTSGALDLCPLRVGTADLGLVPCARVELGTLSAKGEEITPARQDQRLWAAVALPLRLRFEPTSHVFVELEGSAKVPLVRDRFVFQPDRTVFQIPAIAFGGAATAGIAFP